MSNLICMKLDDNLKKLMNEKKINIAELASKVGLAKSTIHGWLNGSKPRSVVELEKVANFFDINIHELCFQKDKENHRSKEEYVIGEFEGVSLILRKNNKHNI